MLQRTLFLASVFSFSYSVMATTPIVTKFSTTGSQTAAEFMNSQRCDLFSDKVAITTTYGLSDGTTTSISREVSMTLQDNFMNMIKEVAAGKLESTANDSCGYPATTITLGDGTPIFDSGGCGKPALFRGGGASGHVREMMAIYCPKTF